MVLGCSLNSVSIELHVSPGKSHPGPILGLRLNQEEATALPPGPTPFTWGEE